MSILLQVAAVFSMYAVFPVLLGLLWNRILKIENETCVEIYSDGYFLMFAMFFALAFPAIKVGTSLTGIAKVWLALMVVISLAAVLLCGRKGMVWLKKMVCFWKNSDATVKMVAGCFVALVVVSILFVQPHVGDYTVSIVDMAVATDTMYGYHPYTGFAYPVIPTANVVSPIEMLYAVTANLTGMQPALLIQFVLPVFLQIWFLTVYCRIGNLLFEDEKKISIFIVLALVLHTVPLYIQNQALAAGIFQNPWNGQTLLGCCVLPMIFGTCYAIAQKAECDWKPKFAEILREMIIIAVLIFSAQLVYVKGIYYSVIQLVIMIAVILLRKGYRRYGTSS